MEKPQTPVNENLLTPEDIKKMNSIFASLLPPPVSGGKHKTRRKYSKRRTIRKSK